MLKNGEKRVWPNWPSLCFRKNLQQKSRDLHRVSPGGIIANTFRAARSPSTPPLLASSLTSATITISVIVERVAFPTTMRAVGNATKKSGDRFFSKNVCVRLVFVRLLHAIIVDDTHGHLFFLLRKKKYFFF